MLVFLEPGKFWDGNFTNPKYLLINILSCYSDGQPVHVRLGNSLFVLSASTLLLCELLKVAFQWNKLPHKFTFVSGSCSLFVLCMLRISGPWNYSLSVAFAIVAARVVNLLSEILYRCIVRRTQCIGNQSWFRGMGRTVSKEWSEHVLHCRTLWIVL